LIEDVGEQHVASRWVPLQHLALRHLVGEAALDITLGRRVANGVDTPDLLEVRPEGHATFVADRIAGLPGAALAVAGALVRMADACGLDVPASRAAYAILKLREQPDVEDVALQKSPPTPVGNAADKR